MLEQLEALSEKQNEITEQADADKIKEEVKALVRETGVVRGAIYDATKVDGVEVPGGVLRFNPAYATMKVKDLPPDAVIESDLGKLRRAIEDYNPN